MTSPYLLRLCRDEQQALDDALASPNVLRELRRQQAEQDKAFRQARMEARNAANTPWDKPDATAS